MGKSIPLEERFWAKVAIRGPKDCWLWLGATYTDGYGQVRIKRHNVRVHRVSWMLAGGSIPDNMLVLHKCDTPKCVNPSHLFLGTQQDNARDMIQKGRGRDRKGEKSGTAKLTANDVLEIRCLCANGVSQSVVAKMFGVSRPNISVIKCGKTWSHVPSPGECGGGGISSRN